MGNTAQTYQPSKRPDSTSLEAATTISQRSTLSPSQSQLLDYAAAGNEREVERLLDSGAAVNTKGAHGRTALHVAAAAGHIDVCRLLLRRGCPVNDEDERKETPLHVAAANDREEVCRWLCSVGADVNAKNRVMRRPADVAKSSRLSLFLKDKEG